MMTLSSLLQTLVGDILVAINPFQSIPHLYSAQVSDKSHAPTNGQIDVSLFQLSERYARRHAQPSPPHVDNAALPPHVFDVAGRAHRQLFDHGMPQCCVISGESGSGKTETAKLLVSQLITGGDELERRLRQLGPLLEAFGNAATLLNQNSSRFGKYIALLFDARGQGREFANGSTYSIVNKFAYTPPLHSDLTCVDAGASTYIARGRGLPLKIPARDFFLKVSKG